MRKEAIELEFQKRPDNVDAIKWDGRLSLPTRPLWFRGAWRLGTLSRHPRREEGLLVTTLWGKQIARPGDYIARDVANNLSVVRAAIFEIFYEPRRPGMFGSQQ